MSTRLLPRFRQATSLKFLLVLMVAAIMLIVVSEKVFARHTVTPGASVDVDADANGGAFTALNDIVFTDEPGVDLAATNTFALTAPAGFEFNPAAAGDTATGSGYGTTQIDLGGAAGAAVAPVYSVGNTVATWTVTTAGAGTAGIITITGMELRPTAGKTAIAGDGTANVTIAGNVTTFNTANAHPIDHVPGVPANLLVETLDNNLTNGTGTPTATQTAGVAFATRVSSRDQHNNVNNDGANIVDGGTVDLAFVTNAGNAPDGTAPIVAVGSGAIAFTNGVVEQNGFILTNAAAAQTITATVQNAGGGNLAAPANGVTGVDAGDTVQSAVPANFLVETLDNNLTNGTGAPTAIQTAGVAFATRITSRDALENVNNSGANIVTGGTVDLAFATNAGNSPNATAPTVAGRSGAIAFTNGVGEQNGFILPNAAAAQTITATVQNAGGGNLAAPGNGVTGVDAGDTVQPAPLANFLVAATCAPNLADVPFVLTLTARDAFGNTNSSGPNNFDGAGNTAQIASTGPLSMGGGTTATFANGVLVLAVTIGPLAPPGGTFTFTATDTAAAGLGTGAETGTSAPCAIGQPGPAGGAPDNTDEMEPTDEGTFDPATGTNTVDATTGQATINLATESTTQNGNEIVRVTDGAGNTVAIDVDDLPAGVTDITVSMQSASAQSVAEAVSDAGLPGGATVFGLEIEIFDGSGNDIGGTTPVTVQIELPLEFDPTLSTVVVNGEMAPVTIVSVGPPAVVEAQLPHLTTVLVVEMVEEEAEEEQPVDEVEEPVDEVAEVVEEPPAIDVLTLNAGGEFVFWTFGPARAGDVFGVVKIAWLFDSTAVRWTSFIPALGITNFALNDGAVLWVVSDTAQEIPIFG